MLKLLLCLTSSVVIGAVMLQLRQQHLDLGNQNNRLHDRIESQQAKLWNQQLQIAIYTSPTALVRTLNDHDLRSSPLLPQQRPPEPEQATAIIDTSPAAAE